MQMILVIISLDDLKSSRQFLCDWLLIVKPFYQGTILQLLFVNFSDMGFRHLADEMNMLWHFIAAEFLPAIILYRFLAKVVFLFQNDKS